eukprot:UN04696
MKIRNIHIWQETCDTSKLSLFINFSKPLYVRQKVIIHSIASTFETFQKWYNAARIEFLIIVWPTYQSWEKAI